MTEEIFCSRGRDVAREPVLYENCGLDNIWLVDGFKHIQFRNETLMQPEDVEGLHRAITRHLVCHRKTLTGREIRFVRRTMGLTQLALAQELGTSKQTVLRWEKDAVDLPGPEDRLLRIFAMECVTEAAQFHSRVSDMRRQLNDLDDWPERRVCFQHDDDRWSETVSLEDA